MNSGLKLQFALIAASGLTVLVLGGFFVGFVDQLTPRMMRVLLPIPPLSVAAYSFVLAFVRDRGGENLPGMMESAGAVLQATLVSAILFALMAAMMLLLTRLITRFF